jgi:ribosomal protein L37E
MAKKIYEKLCPQCGIVFKTTDRKQMNCSKECGNIAGHEKQKKYYVCQHCNKKFSKDSAYRMKYCSTTCANIAKRLPEEVKKERLIKKQVEKQCLWCGKVFVTTYLHKKYCCSECGYAGNLRDKRQEWADNFVPKHFKCKECGKDVTTECGKPFSSFCSIECQEKYVSKGYNQRRKEQMRSAYKEPVSFKKIYKRDKGMCGICGMEVPYDKSPTNIWGATIDHIIPISQGGTHEPSNCQLAHRLCNSIKLDTAEEFLIDWEEKNNEDAGRWTQYLDDYYKQLISNRL